ncbi:MAG: ROK family protein, partial [Cellulomonas sp.]|nr:ROK family protein [Cellulomonas sp.]
MITETPACPGSGVAGRCPGPARNAVELGWYDLPLGDILRARHELPIVIENDANAVGYGEWSRGAGVGSEHLVAFVLGNGAGAGIVSGGKILRGNRSAAGEIGVLLADR